MLGFIGRIFHIRRHNTQSLQILIDFFYSGISLRWVNGISNTLQIVNVLKLLFCNHVDVFAVLFYLLDQPCVDFRLGLTLVVGTRDIAASIDLIMTALYAAPKI